MRYFLLPMFFILLLKADTDSINTSNFDYGRLMPIEFSYIDTKDDSGLYQIGVGIGAFLEYNLIEMQILGVLIPYSSSDTLFAWNDKNGIANTIKYGGTLLYKLNSNWQAGIDYSKYITITNQGKHIEGTTYGDMTSYNLKFLYDPLADIIEQQAPLLMVFSFGYMDAPDIKYKEKVRESYYTHSYIIEKRYDLSGPMITLGLMKKF